MNKETKNPNSKTSKLIWNDVIRVRDLKVSLAKQVYDSNNALDMVAMRFRMKNPKKRKVVENKEVEYPVQILRKEEPQKIAPPDFTQIKFNEKPKGTEVSWVDYKQGAMRRGLQSRICEINRCSVCPTPCKVGKRIQKRNIKEAKKQLVFESVTFRGVSRQRELNEDELLWQLTTFSKKVGKATKEFTDGLYKCVRIDGELKMLPLVLIGSDKDAYSTGVTIEQIQKAIH